MNKRLIGEKKEKLAAYYLESHGIKILEMNYRNRIGEIDIIARDKNVLVFVEVKYRKTASAGHPEEAVNKNKIKNICKVADYYRMVHRINDSVPCRFDVIAIEGDDIRWHENAFAYMR